MNLALQDGGVALTVKLGIGKLDTQIKTDSVRFDDNQWHHVLVSRESSKVSTFDCLLWMKIRLFIQFTCLEHYFLIVTYTRGKKDTPICLFMI